MSPTIAECLEHARQCEWYAARTNDQEDRKFLLWKAKEWTKLAALRRSRKIIRGLKEGLTEEERFAVADHPVSQLKERGDPLRLNEEAPTAKPPST